MAIKGNGVWSITYQRQLTYRTVFRYEQISISDVDLRSFFEPILGDVVTSLPINATIAKICSCDQIGTIIDELLSFEPLPSYSAL